MSSERTLSEKALEVNDILNGGYRDLEASFNSLNISEDDFRDLFTNTEYMDTIFGGSPSRSAGWYFRRCMENLLARFPNSGEYIIENSNEDRVVYACLSGGFYDDIKTLNRVALWEHMPESQLYAVRLCSIKTLRETISSKNSKVRTIAFERLGPVECIGEMLEDSIAKNRELGARYAPYGYKPLSEMTNEIARSVFGLIVSKIDIQYLPMMLANRNIKNKWQSKMIEERLNRGY